MKDCNGVGTVKSAGDLNAGSEDVVRGGQLSRHVGPAFISALELSQLMLQVRTLEAHGLCLDHRRESRVLHFLFMFILQL